MLTLEKYSIGVGDRFAHQAKAQLRACQLAAEDGVGSRAGLEQVEPRAHLHRLRAGLACWRPREAAVEALGWNKRLARRCRPHPPRNRRSLPPALGFLHASTWRIRSASPRRRRRCEAFVDRHPELIGDDRRSRASTRRSRPRARRSSASPASSCSPCRTPGRSTATSPTAKGRGQLHRRSLDGRNRRAADAARAAGHPRRARGRGHSGADDRAEVHRALQQGRRLRRRPRAVREGVSRRPRRDRLCGRALRPAGEPEAERPLAAATSFRSTRSSAARCRSSAPACTSRPPARPGWKR